MVNDISARHAELRLDQQFFAATDVASFFLYHPDDLQHRMTSPQGWPYYHYACQPEFEAGRFVAFETGSDGKYQFRVTGGGLTVREKTWLAGSWSFRYRVRQGCAYIDGGYALPSDRFFDNSKERPDQWISLPNGDYCVTVNAIEWYSEPGATNEEGEISPDSLPNYVFQFAQVMDLGSIEPPTTLPRLVCSRDSPARLSMSFAEFDNYDGDKTELSGPYAVKVCSNQVAIPGFKLNVELSDQQYGFLFSSIDPATSVEGSKQIVIACCDEAPCLGAWATFRFASKSNKEPWVVSFDIRQLLIVTSFHAGEPLDLCHVVPLDRPESNVSSESLEMLKAAFAVYAAANEAYLKAIPNATFEGEMVASMSSPTALTHVLIDHIQIPNATRKELLVISDAERVDRLLDLLKKLTK